MPTIEEDELVAREYTEHWKALHGDDAKKRQEVLDWLRRKKLRLMQDAFKSDESPRAIGARALLDILANIGK